MENDKLLLLNENKALTKIVVDLKTENTCLKKLSYDFVSDADLCDEIATLKVEIEVLEANLKDSMLELRK